MPAESALDYPWASPAPGADPLEILPGVHWVRQSLPSRLNHVNQWLLDDAGRLALIDTGMDRPEARAWWSRTLPRYGRLADLVITHHHYDHIGVAGFLSETYDAPLWMTRTEWLVALARMRTWDEKQQRDRLRHFTRNGLSTVQAGEIGAYIGAFSERLSPIPGTFQRLLGGETINLGGRAWTILIGEGHSPEQALLFCQEANVLIAADQVLPAITPHIGVWLDEPEANPLRRFLETLDRLSGLPEDVLVLPSHGLPFTGLHRCIDRLREHHERRLEQTEAACRDPRSAAEIMDVLFKPPRDVQDLTLGFTEALAHLHQLVGTHNVAVETDGAGLRRFQRAA